MDQPDSSPDPLLLIKVQQLECRTEHQQCNAIQRLHNGEQIILVFLRYCIEKTEYSPPT